MQDPGTPLHPGGRRIEVEVRTSASPEDVWHAWTDPTGLSRWFVDSARGEARAGGTLVWTFRGFGEMSYPVVVADAPERLLLAGEIPGRGPFALEVVIRTSAGATVVRLVNSGFLEGADWTEEYEGVRSGWIGSLALMKHYLEHHRPAPRHVAMVVRPASVGAAELYRHFSAADGLAAWLTREGALGEVGEPAALVLQDGTPLSGAVIAATGREKAVSWNEENGAVVELKGFAAARRRMVGVRLTTWGPNPSRLARLEQLFAPAVERLAMRLSASG